MRCLVLLLSLTAASAAEPAPESGTVSAVAEPAEAASTEAPPEAMPAQTMTKAEADRLRASKTPLTLVQRFALAVYDAREAGRVPTEPVDYTAILPGMGLPALAERLGEPTRIREDGPQAELRWIAEDRREPMFIVWLRNDCAVRMRVLDQL